MKFRHFFILIVVLAISSNAVSQTNVVGYEGDCFMMTDLHGIPAKSRFGIGTSHLFEFKTRKIFSFLCGVSADFQFLSDPKSYLIDYSTSVESITKATAIKINYPLIGRFGFGKKLKFFFEIGFFATGSALFGDFTVKSYGGHKSGWTSYNQKKEGFSPQVGGSTGVGIRYPLKKRMELIIKSDVMIYGSGLAGFNATYNLHLGFNFHFKKNFKQKIKPLSSTSL